jgi:8-oxo-dGTP pyrophosphatase MutT (NUDIX family)
VLLAQDIRLGQSHYFLPGGRIEPQEAARVALEREWEEELGGDVTAGDFLGCVEHRWSDRGESIDEVVEVTELNVLFRINGTSLSSSIVPASKEAHLAFSWIPVSELASISLLPAVLKELIPQFTTKDFKPLWISTIE